MAEKKTNMLDGMSLRDLLDYERATKMFLERYAFVGQSLANASRDEIERYKFYEGVYNKIMNKLDEEIRKLA